MHPLQVNARALQVAMVKAITIAVTVTNKPTRGQSSRELVN